MSDTQLAIIAERFNCLLLPDAKGSRYTFGVRSESSSSIYRVSQRMNNGRWTWGCSCPGWALAKGSPKPPCKHLRNMLPMLDRIFPAEAAPQPIRRLR